MSKRRSHQLSGNTRYAGCGSVGRQSRSASCGPSNPSLSRPSSAKDWVHQCQQRRAEQESRNQQWELTNSHFKANQFHANFFNAKPSAPRCYTLPSTESKEDATDSSVATKEDVAEVATREDVAEEIPSNINLETEKTTPFSIAKENRSLVGPEELLTPEICALKSRLEELQSKNEEERHKLNEELSHRAWQSGSTDARKMESERLNEFVRGAWLGQRAWQEEQRQRRVAEDRCRAQEEEEVLHRHRLHQAVQLQHKQQQKEQYQKDLEDQLHMMKLEEAERRELAEEELRLEAERSRLLAVKEQREHTLRARSMRALAVTWSKQQHVKLRQRASQVLQELTEDEETVRQLQRHETNDQQSFVLNVLAEHRRLESLRDKEWEVMFSEEAAREWRKRDQEWEQEERARSKLVQEVLDQRLEQLEQQANERSHADQLLRDKTEQHVSRVAQVEQQLAALEQPEAPVLEQGEVGGQNGGGLVSLDGEEGKENRRRKEIKRLEDEMARLWGPLYRPPHYGRKKVQW